MIFKNDSLPGLLLLLAVPVYISGWGCVSFTGAKAAGAKAEGPPYGDGTDGIGTISVFSCAFARSGSVSTDCRKTEYGSRSFGDALTRTGVMNFMSSVDTAILKSR